MGETAKLPPHTLDSVVVISFYTLNTPYEQEVLNLIESCENHGIKTCIEGRVSQSSWERNCAMKPFYILEKLEELKRPVFWVDADAVFLKEPVFAPFLDYDISVRINDFLTDDHSSKVISNSIFVNYTLEGLNMIRAWCEECRSQLSKKDRVFEFWDQVALRDVVLAAKNAKIRPMPLGYAKIFDIDLFLIENQEVFIEHYQASRRFKRSIK